MRENDSVLRYKYGPRNDMSNNIKHRYLDAIETPGAIKQFNRPEPLSFIFDPVNDINPNLPTETCLQPLPLKDMPDDPDASGRSTEGIRLPDSRHLIELLERKGKPTAAAKCKAIRMPQRRHGRNPRYRWNPLH